MGRRETRMSEAAAEEYRDRARLAAAFGDTDSAVEWGRRADRCEQRVDEAEQRRGR